MSLYPSPRQTKYSDITERRTLTAWLLLRWFCGDASDLLDCAIDVFDDLGNVMGLDDIAAKVRESDIPGLTKQITIGDIPTSILAHCSSRSRCIHFFLYLRSVVSSNWKSLHWLLNLLVNQATRSVVGLLAE